jgi:group I intron endonuclease
MKLYRSRDLGKSGIYVIKNITNGKVYVGKALCVYRRMKDHVTALNKKVRDRENDHLINAWHKYGQESFEYYVAEYADVSVLSELELKWMKNLNSLNEKFGYNKREDSSTGLIVKNETREKLRQAQLKRFQDPKQREKCSHTFWKDNPDKLKEMTVNLSIGRTEYFIDQFDRSGKLIRRWNTMMEILTENPTYKRGPIYGVCSGEKRTAYNYIWKKEKKL